MNSLLVLLVRYLYSEVLTLFVVNNEIYFELLSCFCAYVIGIIKQANMSLVAAVTTCSKPD